MSANDVSVWRGIDWFALIVELFREVKRDNVFIGAAALAFYLVLSLFPAAIFGLSLLPYLPIPNLYEAVMDVVREVLPRDTAELLTGTIASMIKEPRGTLLSFGLLFALWTSSNGLFALIRALNIVYNVEERRGFVRVRLTALLLTLAFFLLVTGALSLVIFGGMLQSLLAEQLGWSDVLLVVFAAFRWLMILIALLVALSLLYYHGPNRKQPFHFIAPGTVFAVVGMALASVGFRIYVNNFGRYDAIYGSLGGGIVLLLWLSITGFLVLLGGEINQLIYRQKGLLEPKKTRREKSERRDAGPVGAVQ